ncbi:MAG: hypothetical protein ACQEQS_05050 [Thermodesulfobacteriota bacterium]
MEEVINIDVFGEKFSFNADLKDQESRQALDFFLEELENTENRLSLDSKNVSKLVKLLLATMNIANNYLEVQDELQETKKKIDLEVENLLLKL